MRLVSAVLADGHIGANVHELMLVGQTQEYDPTKQQLLYVELADLRPGKHQLVVGDYDTPLAVTDFTAYPPLRGKLISHFEIFVPGETANNPRFVLGQARIPIFVDKTLLGEAVLFLRDK